uniref:Uncharacterized protein n=1 Tax=Zea mays TaxID=4577 RepID=A0A804R640_MAIZE
MLPHPVPLRKATVPMDMCRTGIPATQSIPQPQDQEYIQARCTHLPHSMQRQGASLIPHPLLRHTMQHQGASLTPHSQLFLVLLHNSCTLRSRCCLSMEISREAHPELANRRHQHHTTVELKSSFAIVLNLFCH